MDSKAFFLLNTNHSCLLWPPAEWFDLGVNGQTLGTGGTTSASSACRLRNVMAS